jgi:hypothetical protein
LIVDAWIKSTVQQISGSKDDVSLVKSVAIVICLLRIWPSS